MTPSSSASAPVPDLVPLPAIVDVEPSAALEAYRNMAKSTADPALAGRLLEGARVLVTLGVERVEAVYSGGGDSGQLDDVLCYDAENHLIDMPDAGWVRDMIGDPLVDMVDRQFGGWENNAGAKGTVTFSIRSFLQPDEPLAVIDHVNFRDECQTETTDVILSGEELTALVGAAAAIETHLGHGFSASFTIEDGSIGYVSLLNAAGEFIGDERVLAGLVQQFRSAAEDCLRDDIGFNRGEFDLTFPIEDIEKGITVTLTEYIDETIEDDAESYGWM